MPSTSGGKPTIARYRATWSGEATRHPGKLRKAAACSDHLIQRRQRLGLRPGSYPLIHTLPTDTLDHLDDSTLLPCIVDDRLQIIDPAPFHGENLHPACSHRGSDRVNAFVLRIDCGSGVRSIPTAAPRPIPGSAVLG